MVGNQSINQPTKLAERSSSLAILTIYLLTLTYYLALVWDYFLSNLICRRQGLEA
jgi:hypothetical protein